MTNSILILINIVCFLKQMIRIIQSLCINFFLLQNICRIHKPKISGLVCPPMIECTIHIITKKKWHSSFWSEASHHQILPLEEKWKLKFLLDIWLDHLDLRKHLYIYLTNFFSSFCCPLMVVLTNYLCTWSLARSRHIPSLNQSWKV